MTITHRISPGGSPPLSGSAGDIASQLSGLVNQASGLAGSGVGLPSLNSLGSSINSLASTITGAGSSIASQIAILGTSMASGTMTGMASLVSQMQSQLSSLLSAVNPGNLMSQVLHSHVLDASKGIIASAFQGQHTTTWNNSGVTHSSTTSVTSAAPTLPHNGTILGSDTMILTKVMTAAGFGTSSDQRLKSNIQDYPSVLVRFMGAKVKTFHKKFVATDAKAQESMHEDGIETFGFVAQQLREVFPELVNGDESRGFLSVNEGGVAIVTFAALQEFIVETRREIAELKKAAATHG